MAFLAYCNGKFVPESEASISCMDRGFLYGDGVFDTLRSIDGSIVSFYDHYERLREAADRLHIPITLRAMDLRTVLRDLLVQNQLSDAVIRLTLTRGLTDSFGFGYTAGAKPTLVITVRPSRKLPPDLYQKGVSVEVQSLQPGGMDGVKSTSAQTYVLAKQAALDKGSYETLLITAGQLVLEGTSSNVFMIRNGGIQTPPAEKGVLPGITRKRVIELLVDRLQWPFSEEFFTLNDLTEADEVFLTNTNVEILPVARISGKTIGNGGMGPMTQQLLAYFRQTLHEILQ